MPCTAHFACRCAGFTFGFSHVHFLLHSVSRAGSFECFPARPLKQELCLPAYVSRQQQRRGQHSVSSARPHCSLDMLVLRLCCGCKASICGSLARSILSCSLASGVLHMAPCSFLLLCLLPFPSYWPCDMFGFHILSFVLQTYLLRFRYLRAPGG